MTRKILIVFGILIISFFFSCGKSEEKLKSQSIDSVKYESIDIKGEQVLLRYKFEKGQELKYKLKTILTSKEIIEADSTAESKMLQNLTYIFDLEVLEVEENNTTEFEINISSIDLNANINGQVIKYNSNNDISPESKTKFIEYATISNSPYRARVSERGEVLEVTRLDKMIEKMISIQPQPQKLTSEQKVQLTKNLSDAALRPLTQLIFREFPEKQTSKDSSWVKKHQSRMTVFDIENLVSFHVEDFIDINGDKGAKIRANLSAKWTGQKDGEEEGVKYSFEDPKISGNGIIIFNLDKGILKSAQTVTNVEMIVEVISKDSSQKDKTSKRTEISSNKNIVELL
jgi:hypothetical protein